MTAHSVFLAIYFVAFGGSVAAQPQNTASSPVATDTSETSTNVTSRAQIPSTLMFGIDELNDIQGRMASSGSDSEENGGAQIENATLYLSTILYFGPRDWTIWVNGKPIGPRDEFSEFQVTNIGPRFVEMLVPLSAQGMRPVRLEPNQTFITKSGSVVEGAWKQ